MVFELLFKMAICPWTYVKYIGNMVGVIDIIDQIAIVILSHLHFIEIKVSGCVDMTFRIYFFISEYKFSFILVKMVAFWVSLSLNFC